MNIFYKFYSSILVFYTGDGKFEPFYCNDKYFATEFSKFSKNI